MGFQLSANYIPSGDLIAMGERDNSHCGPARGAQKLGLPSRGHHGKLGQQPRFHPLALGTRKSGNSVRLSRQCWWTQAFQQKLKSPHTAGTGSTRGASSTLFARSVRA